MTKITYKDYKGKSQTIDVDNGLSVMEGAVQNEIPGIDGFYGPHICKFIACNNRFQR